MEGCYEEKYGIWYRNDNTIGGNALFPITGFVTSVLYVAYYWHSLCAYLVFRNA